MSILVTGGRGFIGAHFSCAAVAAGRPIVILDDLSGGSPQPLPPGAAFVQGDLGDQELVASLLRRHHVRAVVHFAGLIQVGESMRQPGRYFDVNLARSLRLLDVVATAGLDGFVFSSTAAVYGCPTEIPIPEQSPRNPVNPYGATKLAFELALESYQQAHGLRWAALRYFNAAGAHPQGHLREAHEPETHLLPLVIDAALGRRPPLVLYGQDYPTPDGYCVRDYIHVCDLADAHLAALQRLESGEHLGPMNLGTGRGYSVREVLEAAQQVVSREVPYSLGPRRPGDPPALVAGVELARQRLGFSPRRSDLRTILEDTLRSRSA